MRTVALTPGVLDPAFSPRPVAGCADFRSQRSAESPAARIPLRSSSEASIGCRNRVVRVVHQSVVPSAAGREDIMAIWELIVAALDDARDQGREWLGSGGIARAVEAIAPGANPGSVCADVYFRCINDPSKKHSPGLRYLKNPRLVTDDPTMRGKRYRLLTQEERRAFLDHPRDDLEQYSYTQVLEWLHDPSSTLALDPDEEAFDEARGDELGGVALLEMHLQDYLFRNWRQHFPHLDPYEGTRGREFVTADPGVGTIDFLCTDREGDFIVIETKRKPSRPTGDRTDPRVHGLGADEVGRGAPRERHTDRGLGLRRVAHGDRRRTEPRSLGL